MLAGFDVVYRCYDQLARYCHDNTMSGHEYQEFAWQPHRLLEAYAMGWRAIEDKTVVRTPEWPRQHGATTTALSLMLADEGVVMLSSDTPMARYVSRMAMGAFRKETKQRRRGVKPNIIHDRVWWTSGVLQCAQGSGLPKLVVVDSDAAYSKNREQAIEFVQNLGCPVLVLTAAPRWVHIV